MDASCVSQYIAKIKLLLENALKPNFSVNLNVLLSHFTSDENKGDGFCVLINKQQQQTLSLCCRDSKRTV